MTTTETTLPEPQPNAQREGSPLDYPHGITFEQVWAALIKAEQDSERRFQKMDEDAARREKEFDRWHEENDRIIKEMRERSRRLGDQMGGLHRSFGELAEHLVAPGIADRFNEMGYHFESVAPGGLKILDESRKKTLAEIDLLLENSDNLMAVEVKTRPTERDIAHHIRRLEILRDHREKLGHKPKRILGAIAGAVFSAEPRQAAIEAGFYVIEQSGDTMKINVPEGFKPREW